jgi:hypothetical protein
MQDDPRISSMSGLPLNTQKFRSIDMNVYSFLDSAAFLNGGLSELVDLLEPDHKFIVLDQLQWNDPRAKIRRRMMIKKGIFPYEYFDSFNVLQEKSLPPYDSFYSKLNNTNISTEEYAFAQEVWKEFKCETFKDYTNLYCEIDVILLAEVTIKFREELLKECGLDMCHYISLPQLGHDIMLKMTKVELELLTDPDQLLFVENGMRGGLSFIGQRSCDRSSPEEDDEGDIRRLIYIDGKPL